MGPQHIKIIVDPNIITKSQAAYPNNEYHGHSSHLIPASRYIVFNKCVEIP